MENKLLLRYKFLQDYLKNVRKIFPDDLLEDLKDKEPEYVQHIQDAKEEFARLRDALLNDRGQENDEPKEPSKKTEEVGQPEQMDFREALFTEKADQPEQMDFREALFAALPTPPVQNQEQKLKGSTMLTPLPSIVEEGYKEKHRHINWPHYKNMLKLFAIDFFIPDNMPPTEQQKKDKEELEKAIEAVGNAGNKRKHLSAQKIVKDSNGTYMSCGKNVIRAMAEKDKEIQAHLFWIIDREISEAPFDVDRKQRRLVKHAAKEIYNDLAKRYHGRE